MDAPYTITKNKDLASPVLYDSPHSGSTYPDDFNYACDFKNLKNAEDNFVEDLFAHVPQTGSAFLQAHFPRTYIDPNRAIDDIDPALFKENWDSNNTFPIYPTNRSDAGIGLIRRLVSPGVPVYNRHLTQDEILNRINNCYVPYHNALECLINDTHYKFGQVFHINCHSMPNSVAYPKQPLGLFGTKSKPVDFVLGDRDGTSSSAMFTRALRDYIKTLGYTVSINDPFKGVEILKRYSDPARGIHSLQLEINKSLYMNELTGEKHRLFDKFQIDIIKITDYINHYAAANTQNIAAD